MSCTLKCHSEAQIASSRSLAPFGSLLALPTFAPRVSSFQQRPPSGTSARKRRSSAAQLQLFALLSAHRTRKQLLPANHHNARGPQVQQVSLIVGRKTRPTFSFQFACTRATFTWLEDRSLLGGTFASREWSVLCSRIALRKTRAPPTESGAHFHSPDSPPGTSGNPPVASSARHCPEFRLAENVNRLPVRATHYIGHCSLRCPLERATQDTVYLINAHSSNWRFHGPQRMRVRRTPEEVVSDD